MTLLLTLTGTNFVSGCSVGISGTGVTIELIEFISSTEVHVTIRIASDATLSARTISIMNPDGQSSQLVGGFVVSARPAPIIDSVVPVDGDQGTAGLLITILGSNFVDGASTTFSGTGIFVNSTTWISDTELLVSVDIGGAAALGARSVTVKNPDMQFGTLSNGFTVTDTLIPLMQDAAPSEPLMDESDVEPLYADAI